ncbi:hypothetical protein ACFPL7_11710 [Dongia soli]|uniref:Uncharacterized protein n=1 Tax=Dongia soli TaxID=600628 RepID=A0ABU5EGI0_9PROT|nr:hypothetical protein [Dongia soli]MDY0885523.1 hypothetical protein [Dongia soli]
MTNERPPHLPPEKARAGRISGRVVTVLVAGFVLVVLLLGGAWLYWSGTTPK